MRTCVQQHDMHWSVSAVADQRKLWPVQRRCCSVACRVTNVAPEMVQLERSCLADLSTEELELQLRKHGEGTCSELPMLCFSGLAHKSLSTLNLTTERSLPSHGMAVPLDSSCDIGPAAAVACRHHSAKQTSSWKEAAKVRSRLNCGISTSSGTGS